MLNSKEENLKKLVLSLSVLFVTILLLGVGYYAGNHFSDYDVLCSKEYKANKLNKKFRSPEGIVLPKDTIVYLRECKPYADVKLEFYIDKWDFQHYQILESLPFLLTI
jgi:hypothetical protein